MQLHPATSVSDVTHYLTSWNPDLGNNMWNNLIEIIENARSHNPYIPNNSRNSKMIDYAMMWEEQTGINFPVMYVASIYLYLYAQNLGCDTFLFATRDCCHWFRIFKKLFPHTNAFYFHCSRNMLSSATEHHNPHYNKYVKSLIKSTADKVIYIDIHGTCQRILEYFNNEFGQFPYCFLLSSSYRNYPQFPKICQHAHDEGKLLNIVFDARGTPIEMLNFDVIGTIQDYNKYGPVRDPPEYSTKKLEAYHVCMTYLLSQMKPWDSIVSQSVKNSVTYDRLESLIRRIYRVIQDNRPILINYIKHPGKH